MFHYNTDDNLNLWYLFIQVWIQYSYNYDLVFYSADQWGFSTHLWFDLILHFKNNWWFDFILFSIPDDLSWKYHKSWRSYLKIILLYQKCIFVLFLTFAIINFWDLQLLWYFNFHNFQTLVSFKLVWIYDFRPFMIKFTSHNVVYNAIHMLYSNDP